tara:strand:+ start:407 stop:661 length:255 start_codon:yes stop_codon:yes gene_type:complete
MRTSHEKFFGQDEYDSQPMFTAIVASGHCRKDGWPWTAEVIRTSDSGWSVKVELGADSHAGIDAFQLSRGFTKGRYVAEFLQTL